HKLCSSIVTGGGNVRTGAELTSLTSKVKVLVALRLGEPLSYTRTVTEFVLGPSASAGVHVMTPFELTVNPLGPDTSSKVSTLGGESVSTAVALAVQRTSSLIVWLVGTVITGAEFTSLTARLKLLVTLRGGVPLS